MDTGVRGRWVGTGGMGGMGGTGRSWELVREDVRSLDEGRYAIVEAEGMPLPKQVLESLPG